jgi:hypothetical protein
MCSRRQSDRSVPRTPFKNGVTDLTRLNGQEYPGLVMLTLVALKGLLHERVDESWHDDIVSVLWMMLSLNEQMSSPCISSSELELLDNRIKVFLHKYKEVFGHVALANSKVGLKKIKFHAPKHCVFYIKRYGSSENTFGGTLESALKSTVKEPTKRTSRRHDHLCKELAARQHDRFCISQSRLENSTLMDDFVTRSSPNRKRQRIPCGDTESSLCTTLPPGWTMHKSVFSLSKLGDQWSTHHGKNTFMNQIVYPNFVSCIVGDVFDNGESIWVLRAVEKANELGFTHIDVCCGAGIPTERVERSGEETKDLFTINCLTDLVLPSEHVEALLPALAIACLRLNSSSGKVDKHILQSVFACALFFNRAKLVPFAIHSRVAKTDFTPKAMAFLHGKRIMDVLTPSEEAFVRFVILVDLMRYHYVSLDSAVQKYGALFTPEERGVLFDFMKTYQGEKVESLCMGLSRSDRKVVKGYHSSDIALFVEIKNQVTKDRQHVNAVMSEINETSNNGLINGSFPLSNRFDILPFTFHYPQFHVSIKKEELVDSGSKKRKFAVSSNGTTNTASDTAMEFDDGDMGFEYYSETITNTHAA